MTTRQLAFTVLCRVARDGAYSNIAFDKAVKTDETMDKQGASFAAALFYGVLERQIALDYTLTHYVKKGLKSLDIEILTILRMGLYQLVYMDGVPDNAAVDESVRLTQFARKASAKGFVNAILRGFIRDGKKLLSPPVDDPRHYSVKYSCPEWLFNQWRDQYDLPTAVALAEASLEVPPLTIRVNTKKTTSEKLIGYLENRGVTAVPHAELPDCLILTDSGSIDRLPQYKQGLFHVQDAASQMCAIAVGAQPNELVMDICSAPGSKAFTIAERMGDTGTVLTFDLFPHKLDLIKAGAERLGLATINTDLQDATVYNPDLPLADRVLCDVPCSGFGIIRRKPEIRFKPPESLEGLPALQLAILENAARYVKPGGRLVYSTCTTNKNENENIVNQFVHKNNLFNPLKLSQVFDKISFGDSYYVTLMPHTHNCDGFFIAVFERNGHNDG